MGWYNSNWDNRVEIEIDSSMVASDLTDYPLLIDERSLPTTFWTSVKSDGSDIVVTSSDGTTKLDRDLAEWDSTNNVVTLRVRVPTLSSSSNTVLYLYYNNSGASETDTTNTYRTEIEAYYPMGEDPGGTAPQIIDRCATPASMTTVGTMTSADLVDAQVSKGIDFDGSDDYIWSSDPTKFTFGDSSNDEAFSFSFWFRADTTTVSGFFGKCSHFNIGEWYAAWGSSKVYFRTIDDSTTGLIGRVLSSALSLSTWYKCTCTSSGSGSSSGMKIYIDGTAATTVDGSSGTYVAMQNTADNARIANRSTYDLDRFNGKIDEVTLFREELSADYILTSFKNEKAASYTFYTLGSEESAPSAITTTASSAVGDTLDPTILLGSLTLTNTASAIGNTLSPVTLLGSLTITNTASAIGDTLDPTVSISSGDILVSPGLASAIGNTLNPVTLLGSLTLTNTASAIGDTLVTVLAGGGTIVTTLAADAIGGTLSPDVLYGSLTASGTASSIGSTLSPGVVHGSLTLPATSHAIGDTVGPSIIQDSMAVSATVSAIGGTLNPTVLVEGSATVSASVSAVGNTLTPTVSLGSLDLTTTEADAIGSTLDPVVLIGGMTFTLTASAIGDTQAPAAVLGSLAIAATVSAVGDTLSPTVLLASLSVQTTPANAIGDTLDPAVEYGSLALTSTASAVGDTIDPSVQIDGSVIVTGASVAAKGDTISPSFTVASQGLELDNVARWIFSSVAAHFEPVAAGIDLLYHVEGIDERGDEVARNDSVELRLTGPNIKEVNGKYKVRTEINVLLTNYMKMLEDTYSIVDWTSEFQAEMMENIPIYRLGTGVYDDGTYLGCLVPTRKEGVKAYYLGQISNVDRIRQSEVDGAYDMELVM